MSMKDTVMPLQYSRRRVIFNTFCFSHPEFKGEELGWGITFLVDRPVAILDLKIFLFFWGGGWGWGMGGIIRSKYPLTVYILIYKHSGIYGLGSRILLFATTNAACFRCHLYAERIRMWLNHHPGFFQSFCIALDFHVVKSGFDFSIHDTSVAGGAMMEATVDGKYAARIENWFARCLNHPQQLVPLSFAL